MHRCILTFVWHICVRRYVFTACGSMIWTCHHVILNAWKGPFCTLRTTQALISMRICAGWSGPALSAYRVRGCCSTCRQTVNDQIRLHRCARWSGPTLSAKCITFFVRTASCGFRTRKHTLDGISAIFWKGDYFLTSWLLFWSPSAFWQKGLLDTERHCP